MNHQQIEEEDIIDRYLIRDLPPELEIEFEDHFLGCEQCGGELERSQEAISLIAEAHAAEQFAPLPRQPERKSALWASLPALGMALAVGVAAIFVSLSGTPKAPNRQTSDQRPARPAVSQPSLTVVQLESYRSGESAGQAIGAAAVAQPFLLRLDLRGVPAYAQYSVRIVGDAGDLVWSREGIENRQGDWLEALVDGAHLERGGYWVRLFGLQTGADPVLLREYALPVGR